MVIEASLLRLLKSNGGERQIHGFLKEHSYLLVMAFNRAWNFQTCVPEFNMGNQLRADFLILSAHSSHWFATFIELKSPEALLYTKAGTAAKALRQAQRQISDCQEWVRVNEPYLRRRFADILAKKHAPAIWPNIVQGYPSGFASGDQEIVDMRTVVEYHYHIVIGRRSQLSIDEQRRRAADSIKWGGPQIATYDRLLDMARMHDRASADRT